MTTDDRSASPVTPTTVPTTAIDAYAVRSVATVLPGWLATVQRAHRLTGVQAAIWHEGELVAEAAAGPADEPAGIDLLTTHRLRIASHSKTFTAILVLALAQAGRLRLDDTVGERVPELTGSPAASRTLRDLLSHSAGLTRDGADARWWQLARPFADREKLLEIARDERIVLAPAGEHLQYSNIGYGLLGLVIEEVTGMSFADAAREVILDPLGLDDIGPDLPADAAGPEDPHGFALGHTTPLTGERRVVEQVPTGALAAATGFWASAAGIATALGRVLCDGAILDEGSRAAMRRRVWTVSEGRHYGLGLQEGTLHGHAVIGHSGGFPTGLTRTWALPTSRLAVSVLGTSVDSPASDLAAGLLGLIALASGRHAPQASAAEEAAAGGGASLGTPRPSPLAEQPGIRLGGRDLSAADVAAAVAGTYDDLWGRMRLAVLGGRLFSMDDTALDPAQGALELRMDGTRPDPLDPHAPPVVALVTWGDVGYGSHLEPLLARIGATGRCTAIIDTGQPMGRTESVEPRDRLRAPRQG